MPRRRNRKRRNRRQRNVWFQFKSQSLSQTVQDEDEKENYRVQQKQHLQKIADWKQDLLSRTVFVSNVLPLGNPHNLAALETFMKETNGPVQQCEIVKGKGRFPRGRVRFHFRRDAQKVFDGKSLLQAQKEKAQVRIPCPVVGHKGFILVKPALEYAGMVQDDMMSDNKAIQVDTEKLAFGHWFPEGKDACANLPGLEEFLAKKDTRSTWVEERSTDMMKPILSFDLERAVVELDITHCQTNDGTHSHDVDDPLSLVALWDFGNMEEERIILSFRFKDLAHPMELCKEGGWSLRNNDSLDYSLVFALKHPPRLSSISVNPKTGYETRTRLTRFRDLGVDILGAFLGYRLQVSTTEINRLLDLRAFAKLKSFGLFRDELDSLQQAEPMLTEQVEVSHRQRLETMIATPPTRTGLLLCSILDNQSCCWFDLMKDKAMDQDIFDLARRGDNVMVEKALAEMRDTHGKTRYPAHMFQALYEAGVEVDDVIPRPIPEFCVDLPRILITPSRVCVTGFQVEMSNRLVRKFIQEEDFSEEAFVRVTIGDENSDKLFSDDISGQVAQRIKDLVLNGIVLVGKKYEFLAYSSSQLKELSLWMVYPEHGWSVNAMRASMGDFSMCTTPSKYAARIGQCFSTTVDTLVEASTPSRERGRAGRLAVKDDLPDITCYNSSTGTTMEHSDGVGLIRKEVLEDLMFRFPFGPKDPRDVSAIQIRYGGAKGVLMAWDFYSLNERCCQGYDVCLRPSMVKFKASYDRLEVVTVASHVPYYLNRNVILLGSHLGIPHCTFLIMQEEMLRKLNSMLTDAECAAAFLPSLSGSDSKLIATLGHMLYAGQEPAKDPFLYSCLHAIRAHHLTQLRKKARIHVEKGAVLIGGIDESGLVLEGCVFVQVRRPNEGAEDEFQPIVGPVMVTKHPVMHPGDIRMLLAVDVPQLRDKKNVILFSRHGERPEADKMSGSDLDGDQFAVTWDDRLFLPRTLPPMDYSPSAKLDESNSINDASLIEHFLNHARNDNLGRIAMLWMDHASIQKDAGCEACLSLAALHSVAVDFPKSGIPARLPDELKLKRTPLAHWREKKGRLSFHCESIVGQLYDQIVKAQKRTPRTADKAMAGRRCDKNGQILILGDATRLMESKESLYDPELPRRLGWKADNLGEMLLDFAHDQRQQYESQLMGLMKQYKIKCEGEVVTGCILKYHKLHKRRRHDITEKIRRQFRTICNEFRSDYFRALYHLVHDNVGFFGIAADHTSEEESGAGAYIEEVEQDDLEVIEAAATNASLNGIGGTVDMATLVRAREYSRRLVAAYYIAAYSHEMHTMGNTGVLYSFPWIVGADVISRAFGE